MPLLHIPPAPPVTAGWDLSAADLERAAPVELSDALAALHRAQAELARCSIDDIIAFFDAWARHERAAPRAERVGPDLEYLATFLRRDSLEALADGSLRGHRHAVDGFVAASTRDAHRIMAHPRGLVVHWLAGNVPALGAISFVQATLAKNPSILKLPRAGGRALPAWLGRLAAFAPDPHPGAVNGSTIARAALCVHCAHDDLAAQTALSMAARVRVAWGGTDAVRVVSALPRLPDTQDIVFGPKYSFAIVAREALDLDAVDALATGLAVDASVHEQYGCNSPHTAFVEAGGALDAWAFAQRLAAAMDAVLRRIPKRPIDADEASRVVLTRAEHVLAGRVLQSAGTEWTVVYGEDAGFAAPCHHRVVFVRPVARAEDVLAWIAPGHQTLGLAMGPHRAAAFAAAATRAGVERITPLGRMSGFDVPWDGIYPMDRMVRWVSWTPDATVAEVGP